MLWRVDRLDIEASNPALVHVPILIPRLAFDVSIFVFSVSFLSSYSLQ